MESESQLAASPRGTNTAGPPPVLVRRPRDRLRLLSGVAETAEMGR
jgi:hypothetical protein